MCFENENAIYHCIRNLNKRLGFSKDYLRDILLRNKLKGKYSWLEFGKLRFCNWLQRIVIYESKKTFHCFIL